VQLACSNHRQGQLYNIRSHGRSRESSQGQTQPDEQITAETFFKCALNLEEPHFLFDVRIMLPKPNPNPDQEL